MNMQCVYFVTGVGESGGAKRDGVVNGCPGLRRAERMRQRQPSQLEHTLSQKSL